MAKRVIRIEPRIKRIERIMKAKEYQKRKDENLARWVERIAAMCQGRSLQDVHAMISEVSKTSYIEGVHAEREINRKCF